LRLPRPCRSAAILPLLALSCVLAGCYGSASAGAAVTVDRVAPRVIAGYQPNAVAIHGSGFARGGIGSIVSVFFRATAGTPFGNGTSTTERVLGTIVADDEITAMAPAVPGIQAGGFGALVDVQGPGFGGTSRTEAVVFAGLAVLRVVPDAVPAASPGELLVSGLAFEPPGGDATVRFTATAGTPFAGGTSATLDVPGTIVSPMQIRCSPAAFATAAVVECTVTVVLDSVAGTPQVTAPAPLLRFLPDPAVPVVVDAITTPVPLEQPTAIQVGGSGFLGSPTAAPDVKVIFAAESGTPFLGGTASHVEVPGVADGQSLVAVSPTGVSATEVTAHVAVERIDGVLGSSVETGVSITFAAPAARAISFAPAVVPGPLPTPFTIGGTALPVGTMATVRFAALAGAPFAGGTAAAAEVQAAVDSASTIRGTTPPAVLSQPVMAAVTVTLEDGRTLPLGWVCVLHPDRAPASCVVTTLADAGPGSLRAALATAPAGCVVTFAPALAGTIALQQSLVVQGRKHVAWTNAGELTIDVGGRTFSAFAVQAHARVTIEGAIRVQGSATLGDGGAFRLQPGSTLTLRGARLFQHRAAGRGGAIRADAALVELVDCWLADCAADAGGGGIFASNYAAVLLDGCTFERSIAGVGGGAVLAEALSTVTAINSTFAGNAAIGGVGGGAILAQSGAVVELQHCTIAGNDASNRGGGVLVQGALLRAVHCLFDGNADVLGEPDLSVQAGANETTTSLVANGEGSGLEHGVDGNLVGTAAAPIRANLSAPQRNGGPTPTRAIRSPSPAVDVAEPAACPAIDQRGEGRPAGGARCDLGAFETRELR
jgi:hypothetical protein